MTVQPPDPGVCISPTRTYAEVQRLVRTVDQINGKINRILEDNREIKGDVSDHEMRLRALELGETPRQQRDEARLAALETRRWPLPTIRAVTGVAGMATASSPCSCAERSRDRAPLPHPLWGSGALSVPRRTVGGFPIRSLLAAAFAFPLGRAVATDQCGQAGLAAITLLEGGFGDHVRGYVGGMADAVGVP
ncbi:hypothetical protein [Streptomyces plumbiresistens]|uniref:Uncharacterized protein n=1 Tax=Streptomyces plumbiresistens TaxID=511811 RepID=A0ABP7TTE8_9ACTN